MQGLTFLLEDALPNFGILIANFTLVELLNLINVLLVLCGGVAFLGSQVSTFVVRGAVIAAVV